MRLVKRGRVGGLRGPGLAPADLALIDGKVDEAAGYAATAAAQLPAVIAAKDAALDEIADGVAVIDGKIDEAEAAQAAAGAQAAIATQQALAAQIAVGALGRPVVCDSAAFPRQHGYKPDSDFVGILQPSAGLVGAFGGDADLIFVGSFPLESMRGNQTYGAFGVDGGDLINLSAELRGLGSGSAPNVTTEFIFEFKASGSVNGSNITTQVVLPRTLRRALFTLSRRGNTMTARFVDTENPTAIVDGTPVTNATFVGCNSLRNSGSGGGMMIGGWGYSNAGPPYSDGVHRYWPGDIELLAITSNGTTISDANLLAIAAGADPIAVMGGGVWKFYRDFSDGVTATSLAKPASVTSDTTTPATIVRGAGAKGDIRKGPTLRRQSQAKYLLNEYVEYGYIWATPDAKGRRQARVRLKGKVAGLSATGANNVRVTLYRRDNSVYWTKVVARLAAADTAYDISFDAPLTDRLGPLDIEIEGDTTLRCAVSKRVGVGYSIVIVGQSQANQFAQYVDQARKAPEDSAVVYVCQRGENDKTQAIEGIFQRYVVGENYNADGLAGFAKRWSELTDAPLVIVEEAVGGTGVPDLLLDGDADVPDLRNPGNFLQFRAVDGADPAFNPYSRPWARMVQRIDYACGKVITAVVHDWISADNAGTFYSAMIAEPMYFGRGVGMIPEYKHYIYDGATFANAPSMVLVPANRHLGNPSVPANAGPFPSGHAVATYYGSGRDTQCNWWRSVGGTVGPQRHALRNERDGSNREGGPHISHAAGAEPGNFLNGQIIAESVGRCFVLSTSQDPYILQLEWGDVDHRSLLVRVKLLNGGRLRTYRNLDDGTGKIVVRGFEANWVGSASASDWSWEEADSTKGLIARLTPGIERNSRDCVRITRPDNSIIPNTFKITHMFGAPLDTGYNGGGFDWVLDTLYDGANFADGLGYSVMSSPTGSTLKEWTIADVVAAS